MERRVVTIAGKRIMQTAMHVFCPWIVLICCFGLFPEPLGAGERNDLVIGVDQDFPPFSMQSADGRPSGLIVDLWKAWARVTGRPIRIRLMDRTALAAALKHGRIDILAGMPPEEAMKGWARSSHAQYRADGYLYRPVRTAVDAASADRYAGNRLGVARNTKEADWAEALDPGVPIEVFDNTAQMLLAAGRGKVSGVLALAPEMAVLPGQLGLAGAFEREKSPKVRLKIRAWAIHPDLVRIVDEGFLKLDEREKAAIEANWIPDPGLRLFSPDVRSLPLSPDEARWLADCKMSGRPVKVDIGFSRPPFVFIGKDGEVTGMIPDMLALLGKRLGLRLVWVRGARDQAADMKASYHALSGQGRAWDQTRAWLDFPWVIITRARAPVVTGIMDMAGKKVAVLHPFLDHVKKLQDWEEIRIVPVPTAASGLDLVETGRTDAYVDNLAAAGFQIQVGSHTGLKVAGAAAMDKDGLCFAVRRDLPQLLSVLDKAAASLSRADKDRIRLRWFTVNFEQGPDLAALRSAGIKIAVGVVAVFGLVLMWNRMIRQREERFKCLTEQGSDLIQAFTAEGRIVYASPSHAAVTGLSPKAAGRCNIFELIHPDDLGGFQGMLDALSRPGEMKTVVHRILHTDGSVRFIESHCTNLLDNRAIRAYVINGRDITQALADQQALKAAKDAAEAANLSKTEFLASLSHEIRTPLNAILGMTETTLAGTLATHPQARNLTAVLSAARHLKAVIGDVLDYSTLEAGQLSIKKEGVCLGRLIEELVRIWTFQAQVKNLWFRTEVSETLPEFITLDPVRTRQILTNLLSNAVKFTDQGGITLTVDTVPDPASDGGVHGGSTGEFDTGRDRDDRRVVFIVEDTGIGIEPDQVDRIFNRFAQAGSAEAYGGTGLGLSISRQMAELLEGTLSVSSAPGRGSTFILALPLEPADPPKAATPIAQETAVKDFTGRCLLLAEDDPVNREVFKEMILGTGCELVCANNGREVLDILANQRVDMVFMDLEMPVMDGLAACAAIREGRAGAAAEDLPVIAMTAHVLPEFRERAKTAGMNGFLPKPVERQELVSLLGTHLNVCSADLIDREKARASVGGDEALLSKIEKIFVSQTPVLLHNLSCALAAHDADAVRLAAHTLKGAGGRVFAYRARDAAARLETLARAIEDDPASDSWEAIDKAGHEALTAFENVIDCLA